jgi:hypothetical protein
VGEEGDLVAALEGLRLKARAGWHGEDALPEDDEVEVPQLHHPPGVPVLFAARVVRHGRRSDGTDPATADAERAGAGAALDRGGGGEHRAALEPQPQRVGLHRHLVTCPHKKVTTRSYWDKVAHLCMRGDCAFKKKIRFSQRRLQ